MGGYSAKCPHCEKWFLSPQALNDHAKAKHRVLKTVGVTDEEALFDVWFSQWERRNLTSDVLGYRAVMLETWKARASLHTSTATENRCACHGLITGACPFDSQSAKERSK